MNISGQIRLNAQPSAIATALHDPQILMQLMPRGCALSQKDANTFEFLLKRQFGPIELLLPGLIVVKTAGQAHHLSFKGAHVLFGKAEMILTLVLATGRDGVTRLDYTGTVEASGLVGRMLGRIRRRRVDDRVRSAFQAFKSLVMASQTAAGGDVTE